VYCDAIKQFLLLAGVGREGVVIECADRAYALPAADWVHGEFARAWAGEALDLGLRYDPETVDCDDFARLCAAFAARLHAQTSDRPRGTALAFGECWYEKDTGENHAINCFITSLPDGDLKLRPSLRFFEPQTGTPLSLTVNEHANIRFLRL